MDDQLATQLASAMTGTTTATDFHADRTTATATFVVKEKVNLITTHGTIPVVAADIAIDASGLPRGTATLDVSAIDTGNGRRDKDLRGSHFFDVAAFPHLAFRSTSSRRDGADGVVDGFLTVRGEDCPLSLTTTLEPQADGTVRVHAEGIFDRMSSPLRRVPRAIIGSQVHVVVEAVLRPGRSDH